MPMKLTTCNIFNAVPEHPQRRKFLSAGMGMMMLPFLPGCQLESKSLSLAVGIWQGYEFLFVAKRQGWFADSSIHIAELPSNAGSLRALISGSVDAAALTLDEVLRAVEIGLKLKIVLVFDKSNGADVLLSRPEIDSIDKLAGKRVGYAQGTNADLLLALALEQSEMTPNDLQRVNVTFGDHLNAWRQGEVDALITYNPVLGTLLAEGARNLFNSAKAPNRIVDVLAVRADVIEDRDLQPLLEQVLAAHFRALTMWQQAPAKVGSLMAQHLGVEVEQLSASYDGLELPDLQANRDLLGGPSPILLDSARNLVKPMMNFGLLQRDVFENTLVTDLLLPGIS